MNLQISKKAVVVTAIALSLTGAVFVFIFSSLADFPGRGNVIDWGRAANIYTQANSLSKAYKTNEAIEKFKQAIQIYPYDPRFHVALGLAYMDKDQYKDAYNSYKNAIALNARYSPAWLHLSQVDLVTGDIAGAGEAAGRAMRRAGGDPLVLGQMALVWTETGQKDKAEKIFNQSTSLGSQSHQFWLAAGKYHWRTGQLQRAEADFSQAAALEPGNSDVWEWLGLLLGKEGKAAEAEKDLKTAVQINANSPVKWRNLALFYLKRGLIDKAVAPLNRAAELPGKQSRCWRDLGRVYLRLKKYPQAEAAFMKVLEIDPEDGPTCGLYVETLRLQKKYDDAESFLKKYIMSGHRSSALLWVYLASIYEESADIKSANKAYKQALSAEPSAGLKVYILKQLKGPSRLNTSKPLAPGQTKR